MLIAGVYEYADTRPYKIISRVRDKVDIPSSDRTFYNLFFKNELKTFGEPDHSSKSIDDISEIIPAYDSVDEIEHDWILIMRMRRLWKIS